jgi:hypothetical protein
VVPVTQEAGTGGSFEPWSSRPSCAGNIVRLSPRQKNKKGMLGFRSTGGKRALPGEGTAWHGTELMCAILFA